MEGGRWREGDGGKDGRKEGGMKKEEDGGRGEGEKE